VLLADLETAGLEYFDDYFELSGNWPDWLLLYGRMDSTGDSTGGVIGPGR
jgi:hypothetical protein